MAVAYNLGPRLQKVADFVPKKAKLGDIGTDHAYLPIILYETHQIERAVAVDVHEGPYQSAVTAVKARRLSEVIDVRLGDGLMPLKPGEVDILTLAGMGGRTMLEILSVRPDVLAFVRNLILQPQGAEGTVRLTLLESGWYLKAEALVEEEGRYYTVMALSKEEGWNLTELNEKVCSWEERLRPFLEKEEAVSANFTNLIPKLVWQFGPLVLEERSELLGNYLREYANILIKRMEQMKKSSSLEIGVKLQEVGDELAIVEGFRTWQRQLV
jgi:tRNA (adenine22-N1)-methyltransferase